MATLVNPDNIATISYLRTFEQMAAGPQRPVQPLEVRRLDELDAAITAVKTKTEALVVPDEQLFSTGGTPRRIADLAIRNRMPSIGFTGYAESGGLIDYGINARPLAAIDGLRGQDSQGRQAGRLTRRADSKFELGVNLKTAKALGVTIPPSVLGRADRVVE